MTRLAANAGVSAIVSTRIYPHSAPQSATMPYIVYQRIDAVHEHHMRGASGMYHSRVQLDLYVSSYSGLIALRDVVRLALDGYVGDITVGSDIVRIKKCFLDNDQEIFYPPEDATQKGIFRAILDYIVTSEEVTPSFT